MVGKDLPDAALGLLVPPAVTAGWIRLYYPALRVLEISATNLEIVHPNFPDRLLAVQLPHADFHAQGFFRAGQFRQTFKIREGCGQVEDQTMWRDEDDPLVWQIPFENWVGQCLGCLLKGSGAPTPL